MKKAEKEDRLPSGDYGKIGCIDIAYGEKNPDVARDVLPATASAQQMNSCMENHLFYIKKPPQRWKKRNKATNGNPYQRKLNKIRRLASAGNEESSNHGMMHCSDGTAVPEQKEVIRTPLFHGGTLEEDEQAHPQHVEGPANALRDCDLSVSCSDKWVGGDTPNKDFGRDDCNYIEGFNMKTYEQTLRHSVHDPTVKEETYFSEDHTCELSEDSVQTEVSYTSIEETEQGQDQESYIYVMLTLPAGFETPMRYITPGLESFTSVHLQTSCNNADVETPVLNTIASPTSGQQSRVQRVTRSAVKFTTHYIRAWRPRMYR